MTQELREALDAFTNTPDIDDSVVYEHEEVRALQVLAEKVRMFLDANPHADQALSLLRAVKANAARENAPTVVVVEPFDLPAGYVQATEMQNGRATGFTCGIAPDGAVSS